MDEMKKVLEISRLIGEITNLMRQNRIKSFENIGITAPQSLVVAMLSRSEKMKLGDLSNKMNLSNSTVSGIVDRLEKRGIVERIRSEEDRRVTYIAATQSFNDSYGNLHKKMEEYMHNVMSKASDGDIDKITEGLNTLKRLLADNKIND